MKKIVSLILSFAMMTATVSCNGTKENTSSTSSEKSTDNAASQNENKEDIVITMAIEEYSSDFWKEPVDEFNAADNGYKIVIKNYVDAYGDDGMPNAYTTEEQLLDDMELLQDIMNTDEIDIICNASFRNEIYYKILQKKGAFADLYTFMEDDTEVNTSTLNQHILSLNEINGKLFTLPTYYNVTTLMGEKQYVGDKENWTLDDFMSHWENMPEGSTISGARYAETVYRTILRSNLNSFIDYENAEVHFDSPEFKKILEFCNTFPSDNGQSADYDYYDYESPMFAEQAFFNGIESAVYFGEDKTMVGYPSSDGEGAYFSAGGLCYSISSKSSLERQKGAWQFIRTLFTKEAQLENVIESYVDPDWYDGEPVWSAEAGFCINNEAFEQMAEDVVAQKFRQPDGYYVDKDGPYEPVFPTNEDVDELRHYIESIDSWEVELERSLWEIIEDEVTAYFAGEKSLNEAVDLIQNRASIWVSEQT